MIDRRGLINMFILFEVWDKIFATGVGAAMTGLGLYVNSKVKKKDDKKKVFNRIITDNRSLFEVVLKGATGEGNIDYIALREELDKSSILLDLWDEPRQEFIELYRIHSLNPDEYNKSKKEIYPLLCKIESEFEKCGVDLFGKR